MRSTKSYGLRTRLVLAAAIGGLFSGTTVGQVLFEDDFDDGAIDTAKWRADRRPFETGGGTYEATEADGTLTIAGMGTQNWWGGLALATVPTFTASADAPLVFEVDRVLHERVDNLATGAGENSSTRTSIWITEPSRANYVLFSQNSNEGGWTYNKRVGDPDDNATNTGISIGQFDFLDADFGEHVMGMEANGETVQLFLDGTPGPLVRFPFTEGIVFEIAVYARRGEGAQPTDSVMGVFDNVLITGAAAECVSLTPPFAQVLPGEDAEVTLQIPADVPRPATVTVSSDSPDVVTLAGAAGAALAVTFDVGDEPFRALALNVVSEGLAELSLALDFNACTTDPIKVFVPAVLLEDDFEDDELDSLLWREDEQPFEDGDGFFTIEEVNGVATLSGEAEEPFWPGIAVMTRNTFNPTVDRPVTFQIDETLLSTSFGAFRAGVWIADCEREDFVFFSFIRGTTGDWVVNSTTRNDWPTTGDGTDLAAYNCCGFDALDVARRVELVANSETVAVVMDGVKGGEAPFPVDDVVFGFGAYALGGFDVALLDSVAVSFDNARILGDTTVVAEGCGPVGPVGPVFRRGDPDDSGMPNISDAVTVLNFLFGDVSELACQEAADIDNDGTINISDAVRLLNFLFGGAAAVPPEAPGIDCGVDPREPTLDCAYTNC